MCTCVPNAQCSFRLFFHTIAYIIRKTIIKTKKLNIIKIKFNIDVEIFLIPKTILEEPQTKRKCFRSNNLAYGCNKVILECFINLLRRKYLVKTNLFTLVLVLN